MSSSSTAQTRQNSVSALKMLYYVVLGLAIAEALSRTFLSDCEFIGLRIFDREHLPTSFLLVAFIFTLCRFAHGASMHLDSPSEKNHKHLCDFIGFFLQALFFYLMAITVGNTCAFVLFFIVMLVFDALWLLLLRRMKYIPWTKTETQWVISDAIIILAFVPICFISAGTKTLWLPALITLISLAAAVWDYCYNWGFYFPKDK